jgi:hypothetical protein
MAATASLSVLAALVERVDSTMRASRMISMRILDRRLSRALSASTRRRLAFPI